MSDKIVADVSFEEPIIQHSFTIIDYIKTIYNKLATENTTVSLKQ